MDVENPTRRSSRSIFGNHATACNQRDLRSYRTKRDVQRNDSCYHHTAARKTAYNQRGHGLSADEGRFKSSWAAFITQQQTKTHIKRSRRHHRFSASNKLWLAIASSSSKRQFFKEVKGKRCRAALAKRMPQHMVEEGAASAAQRNAQQAVGGNHHTESKLDM